MVEEFERSIFSIFRYHTDINCLEFQWLEETKNMSDLDFQIENLRFANLAERLQVGALLIDVREFGHKFEMDLKKWRGDHIIPKYNRAWVKKMAFLHPESFDPSKAAEMQEGNYTVKRFNDWDSTVAWISEEGSLDSHFA